MNRGTGCRSRRSASGETLLIDSPLVFLLFVLPGYPLVSWDPQDNDYPWNGFGGAPKLGLLKPDVIAPTGTTTTTGSAQTCFVGPFGGTSNATPVVMGCMMLWK